jgi:phenylacetate-CoA ligase
MIKGTKVKKYFDFYKTTLNWNREEIEKYQFEKFKKLLNYANKFVPYYQRIFKELDLTPDSFKGLQDIKKMPPLTRRNIQEHQSSLMSTEDRKVRKKLFKGGSSGTTGVPISYFHDVDGESSGIAAGMILWHLSGWQFGEKGLHIWGNVDSIKRWNTLASKGRRFLFNQKNIASPFLNDIKNYSQIVEDISKYNPDYIDGYTNSIYSLAQYILEHNLTIPKCKYIFTTAENLMDHQKEIIENALGPIADVYGCGEINGIAAQTIESSKYYIFEPHAIVETEESSTKGFYEIMITDLDNKVMPFIRYKVGDLIDGVYAPGKGDHIKFKFFNQILGRTADIIELENGKKILPVNLVGGTFIRQFKQIVRHKVIWNGKTMHLIFEINNSIDKKDLHKKLLEVLSPYNINFTFELTDKILPDKNGKYKYFELQVKK